MTSNSVIGRSKCLQTSYMFWSSSSQLITNKRNQRERELKVIPLSPSRSTSWRLFLTYPLDRTGIPWDYKIFSGFVRTVKQVSLFHKDRRFWPLLNYKRGLFCSRDIRFEINDTSTETFISGFPFPVNNDKSSTRSVVLWVSLNRNF